MEPLSTRTLNKFFAFMNSIDTSGKVKFTMSIANNDSVSEFLDLSLHINEHNKTCVPNLPTVSHMIYHQLAIPKIALTKFIKG